MRAAKTFDDVEEAWTQFLQEIQAAWNKLELLKKVGPPALDGWIGQQIGTRRTDPLLSYLHHARNCHDHSLQDISARHSGGISISAPLGAPLHIRSLRVRGDGTFEYDGSPAVIQYHAPRFELLKVLDRGKWFDPPTTHLGKTLESPSAESIGDLALSFYKSLADEADTRFFTQPS
jgi:hypothetical protein